MPIPSHSEKSSLSPPSQNTYEKTRQRFFSTENPRNSTLSSPKAKDMLPEFSSPFEQQAYIAQQEADMRIKTRQDGLRKQLNLPLIIDLHPESQQLIANFSNKILIKQTPNYPANQFKKHSEQSADNSIFSVDSNDDPSNINMTLHFYTYEAICDGFMDLANTQNITASKQRYTIHYNAFNKSVELRPYCSKQDLDDAASSLNRIRPHNFTDAASQEICVNLITSAKTKLQELRNEIAPRRTIEIEDNIEQDNTRPQSQGTSPTRPSIATLIRNTSNSPIFTNSVKQIRDITHAINEGANLLTVNGIANAITSRL